MRGREQPFHDCPRGVLSVSVSVPPCFLDEGNLRVVEFVVPNRGLVESRLQFSGRVLATEPRSQSHTLDYTALEAVRDILHETHC